MKCKFILRGKECNGAGNNNLNHETHRNINNCPNKEAGYWITCHNTDDVINDRLVTPQGDNPKFELYMKKMESEDKKRIEERKRIRENPSPSGSNKGDEEEFSSKSDRDDKIVEDMEEICRNFVRVEPSKLVSLLPLLQYNFKN